MNNDLISREALKKVLSDPLYRSTIKDYGEILKYTFVMDIIDNAPTIEPFEPDYVGAERVEARQRGYEDGYRNGMKIGKTLNPKIKQGEWIWRETGAFNYRYGYFTCSNCSFVSNAKQNFCAECGADMRKGGKE